MTMTQTVGGGVADLRALLNGPVFGPEDSGYDEARKVWNAANDRRPAMIARCASAADVAAAIRFAGDHDLEIAVRGGAHSPSGNSTVDDGVVIDLSALNHVTVDPDAKLARAGGGALLGDLDAATQAHGLAVPAGMVSHTGIGGLVLGGGMGWFTRKAGLSIDNLVSAEVVTADGRILRASATDHPDLFWALRGGGGNFGVVTEFEFRLHEAGPLVQYALVFWELDQGPEVLRLARELVPTLPLDLSVVIGALNAPPASFVPEQYHFTPGYALLVTGFGDPGTHADVLARIRQALPPAFEFVTPMPYVELQQLIDEANAWGLYYYDKSLYLEELSDEVIQAVVEQVPRRTSPMSIVLFYRLDGAYSAVPDDATAFSGGRSPRYCAFMIAATQTLETLPAETAWVRSCAEALRPYAPHVGTYVNAMDDTGQDRVQAAYGPAKYQRLRDIKLRYDPRNVFHRNVNIPPADGAPS